MEVQDKLVDLQKVPCPVRFELLDKKSSIEVQYFIEQKIPNRHDLENGYCVFAVTTDGWGLLIDANFDSDAVMQKEANDIDFIDITLSELLAAKHVFL